MASKSNPEQGAAEAGRSAQPAAAGESATTKAVTMPTGTGSETVSFATSHDIGDDYVSEAAILRIHVDVAGADSDTGCLPSSDDIKVFCGDRRLDGLRHEGGDCFVGEFDLDGAMVDVVADPFTCGKSCRCFEPAVERTAILLTRGCTAELTLSYLAGSSAIQITPRLVQRRVGYPVNGYAEPAQPIPGVRFLLFQGRAGSGTPLERVTTVAKPTVSFTDLRAGELTLVVDAPRRFNDRPIELRNARYATYPLQIGAGQSITLDSQFEFEPAAGGVIVQVVADADDRIRVQGVPVRLVPIGGGDEPNAVATDAEGLAVFADVPAGDYRVELTVEPARIGSRTWTTRVTPIVTVSAQDSRGTVELRLVEDRHLVRGTVYGPDGGPVGHALVEIRERPDDREALDTALADGAGCYEWEAPCAGTFYLTTVAPDGGVRRVVPVSVHSVANADLFVGGAPSSTASNGGATRRSSTADEDPTPFPLLVGNVDLTEGTAPRGGGGAGHGYDSGTSAGATVSAAIRDVLGYRSRTTDTKGFVAALQRSFSCEQRAGYRLCTWTPRSYASTIPSDLGALTGAQASIYERAKVTLDATVPLLDGLTPLIADADSEDVEAIRAIVRSRLQEIVAELALEGGPRTQRVDELFERLTERLPSTDPRQVVLVDVNNLDGELKRLGERFGMFRNQVNTIAEEENFTNFLIIVDSVATLFVSWQQTRAFFDRGIAVVDDENDENAPFLGTQLVLISRQLNVVSETVRETYFAMDSVFLGAAERQTVLLRLRDEGNVDTTILLSELLDWVDRFVTDEGPQLIEEAGTDGVNAFVPTIARLATLVESVARLRGDPLIPPTFFTGRVQLALAQLAGQLRGAANLALAVFDRLKVEDIVPAPPKTGNRNMVRGGRR